MNKLVASTVMAWVLLAVPARADVVPAQPEAASCMAGSVASTCHGGAHCRALTCDTDAKCTGGAVCTEIQACVRGVSCAGNIPPGEDALAYVHDALEGACPASGTCAKGTCQSIRVCVKPGTSTATSAGTSTGSAAVTATSSTVATTATATENMLNSGQSSGCNCALGGRGGAGLVALTFALGTMLVRRRRRS